jgi:hypothetical protein
MGRLAQGQYLTPRRVGTAWGAVVRLEEPAPVAGKPWKWTIPGTYLWRLISLRVTLTSSAQAANRSPGVAVLDNRGVNYYEAVAAQVLPATQKVGISVVESPALITAEKDIPQVLAIPEMLLEPEFVLEGVTPNLQTEDQYSAVQVLAEQIEPNPDHPIQDVAHKAHAIRLLETAVDLAST